MGYVFRDQYGVVTAVDESKLNEPKEIRFITPEYRDLFRIPDVVAFCFAQETANARRSSANTLTTTTCYSVKWAHITSASLPSDCKEADAM